MMDIDQKKAFLQLPLEQQLLAIIDGQTYIRDEIKKLDRRIENLETDLRLHRQEALKNGNTK